MGWTFVFTDMIEAFPAVEPRDERVVADLYIKGSDSDSGHSGSFAIKWYKHAEPTPQLEAFCDSWEALDASGVLPLLVAHDTNKDPMVFGRREVPPVTIDQIKAELRTLGFDDDTAKYRAQGPDRCTHCNGSEWIYKTKENSAP